jgi:hypothetical protein
MRKTDNCLVFYFVVDITSRIFFLKVFYNFFNSSGIVVFSQEFILFI